MSYIRISGACMINAESVDAVLGLSENVTLERLSASDIPVVRLCSDDKAKTAIINSCGIMYVSPFYRASILKSLNKALGDDTSETESED